MANFSFVPDDSAGKGGGGLGEAIHYPSRFGRSPASRGGGHAARQGRQRGPARAHREREHTGICSVQIETAADGVACHSRGSALWIGARGDRGDAPRWQCGSPAVHAATAYTCPVLQIESAARLCVESHTHSHPCCAPPERDIYVCTAARESGFRGLRVAALPHRLARRATFIGAKSALFFPRTPPGNFNLLLAVDLPSDLVWIARGATSGAAEAVAVCGESLLFRDSTG